MSTSEPSNARGVLICANPFSGSGPNRRYVDELVAALSNRGFQPKLIWDEQERKATLADPSLADWCRCVVVAGGDGSIGAVVNELYAENPANSDAPRRPVALATLPMGNENLFARHFGFTLDPEKLAQAIEAGRTRQVDLGCVSTGESGSAGQLFTLMAGVGFDADVVYRMQHWRQTQSGLRRVSRISYLPRIMSAVFGYRYPKLQIVADNETLMGVHLFVFNLPTYGGGLKLAPNDCAVDDGLLDWVLFEKPGLLALFWYGLSVYLGRHLQCKGVKHGRSTRLAISEPSGVAVQIDGDPSGLTPIELRIADHAKLELLTISGS